MGRKIFVSVGRTSTPAQQDFVCAIEERLRAEGLIPCTVGRNTWTAGAPLKKVVDLMTECVGVVIIALERTYYPEGIEHRGGTDPERLNAAVELVDRHVAESRGGRLCMRTINEAPWTYADLAEMANRLAHEVLGRSLDELPPQTRRLLLLIDEMVREECKRLQMDRGDFRFSRRDIRAFTGWGDTQLKVHLHRLEELEYLLAHRGGRGQSFVYELLFDVKDGGYWEPWHAYVKDVLLARGMISPADMALYKLTHSVEDAMAEIRAFYRIYHSMRYVKKDLVVRLNRNIKDSTLERLNSEFRDIIWEGTIERVEADALEANEPNLKELPRLKFRFDRHGHSRFRQMIDLINQPGS